MNDFQIVTAKTLLQVQSISPIRGFLPISAVVLGFNFDRATEVIYNGVSTTEFIVQSKTRLIVKIPPNQVGQPFKSVQVIGDSLLATSGTAMLSLGLSNPLRKVYGLSRLVQSFVVVFLTTPGSDVFSPQSGGGGKAIIGRTTDRRGTGVSADLAQAISATSTELTTLQSKQPNIPLSEKLLSASLQALSFDEANSTLLAQVALQNMMGQNAQVSFSGATSSG